MSGTWPASPAPTSVQMDSIQPTLVSTAQSLKRQVRTRGGQRWAAALTYGQMNRASFAPIWAFLVAQRGQYETFTIVLSGYDTPQGSWAGTPLVNGASQTGRTINIDGFTPSATGVAKAGDVIKFAGHSKVYMVTADANANGSGQAALAIEPALCESPADNAAVTYTSTPFTMALAQDRNSHNIQPATVMDGNVSMVEVY